MQAARATSEEAHGARRGRGWRPASCALAAAGLGLFLSARAAPFDDEDGADRTPVSPEDERFFEAEVRPILEASCFDCHGPDAKRVRGGLRMSGTAALERGGDRGPSIDRDHPAESLLLRALSYEDDDLEMPPDGKLGEDELATLRDWVARGAPWPDYADTPPLDDDEPIDVVAGRAYWSFRPVERPTPPAVAHAALVRDPIDAFVFARLEEAGLEPNPPATPRELVRRAYFNLIGLPPTRAEVEAFEADPSDEAWARLVDDLLARPEYGQRWARHWLDVVRFAQTNGYERDTEKPYAWRYRDWVVDAFNADKPYDRFLIEQLAGDELDDVTTESMIATGFYRIGPWDDEPDDEAQAEFDDLDDIVRTISEGMMGVTLGCARCHDHKFDPFEQEDYYRFLSFVRSIDRYTLPRFSPDSGMLRLLDTSPKSLDRWRAERAERVAAVDEEMRALREVSLQRCMQPRLDELDPELRTVLAKPRTERTEEESARLWKVARSMFDLDRFRGVLDDDQARDLLYLNIEKKKLMKSFRGDLPWALVVSDVGDRPKPTAMLVQGQASSPLHEVEPRFVRVLCPNDAEAEPGPIEPIPASDEAEIGPGHPGRARASTGRRSALARWLADADHPLTARVIVNRIWHHQFGRGIVATPNDFGQRGAPPTHPELLDHLASELVDGGWSLKALQRRILNSYTWRMSSRIANPTAHEADPDNALLWRQNLRRLDAEALRDATLAVAGTLESRAGGRGFFPELSREALAGMSRPGMGWEPNSAAERARRSLYAYVKRGMLVPLFVAFDAPSPNLPIGARPTTTVAPQALTLLNSDFIGARATELARRARADAGGDLAGAVDHLFRHAFARPPTEREQTLARDYVTRVLADLTSRALPLAFRPKAPRRLEVNYLKKLAPSELLYGPRDGWTYGAGSWESQYNDTREQHPERGPFALYDGAAEPFVDGTVRARLAWGKGCKLAGLYVRAARVGDLARGLEVAFLPEDGSVELRRHSGEEAPATVLASAALALPFERDHDIRLELAGARVALTIDGAPVLAADDPEPVEGHLGVRVVDATLTLTDLTITAGGETRSPRSDRSDDPELGALAALALVILNTNEFSYVD